MSNGDNVQVVVFRVGGQDFAFDIFQVQRILGYEAPAALPKAPPFLAGVLSVQGTIVPVIDLRKRFDLPEAEIREETRIMVLECDGAPIGAVVDAVVEVLRVSAAQIAPPPPIVRGLAAEYVQGIISLSARTIIMLHAVRLLNSSERLALETFQAEPAHG